MVKRGVRIVQQLYMVSIWNNFGISSYILKNICQYSRYHFCQWRFRNGDTFKVAIEASEAFVGVFEDFGEIVDAIFSHSWLNLMPW